MLQNRGRQGELNYLDQTMAMGIHTTLNPPTIQIGVTKFGDFEVEVIDPVEDYLATLKVWAT